MRHFGIQLAPRGDLSDFAQTHSLALILSLSLSLILVLASKDAKNAGLDGLDIAAVRMFCSIAGRKRLCAMGGPRGALRNKQ